MTMGNIWGGGMKESCVCLMYFSMYSRRFFILGGGGTLNWHVALLEKAMFTSK